MKILILTNSLGGLQSFRKEVLKALIDEGHSIFISAPFNDKVNFFEEMGCKLTNTHFNRKGLNPMKDLIQMMHYRKLIKKEKPNVVLSYTIKPNLYGGIACQLCGVPQIANVTGLGSAVENPGWLQRLTIFLYKISLRKTQVVFFQNKANMFFCQRHKMVEGNARLIPGSGVNLQYHKYQEYPPENEPVRFIFISRLLREKGIEEYLTAAEKIKQRHPDTEFHILGNCEEAYHDIVMDLQNRSIVQYHGRQNDVRPFIGRCHCTVHPSFYPEGMSNVLLESCATGRPIITTDRPGCGEIVENGVNGFIVRQRDSENVIEIIENFLALPYEKKRQMGISARKKVEREFDRNFVVNAYLEEISSLKSY